MKPVFISLLALALVAAPALAQEHTQHQSMPNSPAPSVDDTTSPPEHDQSRDDQAAHHDEHVNHHAAPSADEPTESERAHVPPDPPQHPLRNRSEEEMIELMQMEDDASYGMALLDQLEWREIGGEDAQAWEAQAWYGNDYNKLWVESEGERLRGDAEGRAEILWDRIVSRWWSAQTGVRQDFGEGPSRTWADIGIRGLAPYFFEIDAAFYVGEEGRTAARFSGEYDLLITQRLILKPELEFEVYGKDDPKNGIGSGLSGVELGLRLRYEFRREFAPYLGVQWQRKFGGTADIARNEGHDVNDLSLVAGLRAWF